MLNIQNWELVSDGGCEGNVTAIGYRIYQF